MKIKTISASIFRYSSTIVLIALLTLPAACDRQEMAQPANETAEFLRKMVNNGAVVIDVRTPAEYRRLHLKGAVNIPLGEMQSRLDELGPVDRTIILYCNSGSRSGAAKKMLNSMGYVTVINIGSLYDFPKCGARALTAF